mgnify:FL=1
MALFNKNTNETAYVGGKKHWTDVIKNSGPGELLIWRQPEEDFNTNSTLVVMPGEEAIFIKGGTVEQTFENGTYKLSTENYPFIGRLRNAFSGGVSTFNCIVYFVRSAHSMEILWGTDSPIQVRDKVWGVRTDVRTRGSYKVKIDNPVVFLEKLLGNNIPFETQEELNLFFSNQFQSKIKTVLSNALNAMETELIGLDARLEEFSESLEPAIDEILGEYGITCIKFVVAAADVDTTKYDVMDQAQMESIMKMQSARGDKGVMDILGDDWGRQQAANILGNLANNPGAGGVAAAGAGMGMGMAAGGAFGSMAQQMFAPMSNQSVQQTPQSQSAANRFAPKEESAETAHSEDPMEVLVKLKKMLDAGLIEESEYNAKKAEVLERM